jgi:hypothetical protein
MGFHRNISQGGKTNRRGPLRKGLVLLKEQSQHRRV